MTSADQIRAQLDRILADGLFANADRRARLLRFMVERSLAGDDGALKESVIAVEVFDRSTDHDPKVDSLVRVEMGRLRSRLVEYYAKAGSGDPVRIEIPKGSYAPVFTQLKAGNDTARRWNLQFTAGVVVVTGAPADGSFPYSTLIQATDGNFYGTASTAGNVNGADGEVFSLSLGLSQFVKTAPSAGLPGTTIFILGTNLSGATSVDFAGTSASFRILSSTQIAATVPGGAISGKVHVTTPAGKLASNVPFRVKPQITSFSPTVGPIGTPVTIDGNSLTGTLTVTFGGVRAAFSPGTDTFLTATVPPGAKTGPICVTTPGGTVCTTASFTVN